MYAANENANWVIGIRSNNLLKSCCELRILFENYVYSPAHPVACTLFQQGRLFFFLPFFVFFRFIFFSLRLQKLAVLLWFDFLLHFHPPSLSKYKFYFGCVLENFALIVKHWNEICKCNHVYRHNVLHMCLRMCFLLFVVEVTALSLLPPRKKSENW